MRLSRPLTTSIQRSPASASRGARIAAAAALFAGVTAFRVYGIGGSFWLHGDQIRDWTIALGGWQDLPLGGTPSSVGGRTLGPVFYWTLHLIRTTLGPFFENLPHAGAIGLSLIQSAADTLLCLVLWRRSGSLPLTLAIILAGATSPFDAALSATVWNPPLAVAFVKVSTAIVLASSARSLAADLSAIGICWLAVQAHSSAIFVMLPMALAICLRAATEGGRSQLVRRVALIGAVILVLQMPFIIDSTRHPTGGASPTAVVDGLTHTLTHPGDLRINASASAVAESLRDFALAPWQVPYMLAILTAAIVIVTIRYVRDRAVLAVSVGPLVAVIAGFATWQRAFDSYWFLTIVPAFTLTLGLAVTPFESPRIRGLVGSLLVVGLLIGLPARFTRSRELFRMPEYRALVSGSRAAAKRAPVLRAITAAFPLPPTTDATFLYRKVFHGKLSPDARTVAIINADGTVQFRPSHP